MVRALIVLTFLYAPHLSAGALASFSQKIKEGMQIFSNKRAEDRKDLRGNALELDTALRRYAVVLKLHQFSAKESAKDQKYSQDLKARVKKDISSVLLEIGKKKERLAACGFKKKKRRCKKPFKNAKRFLNKYKSFVEDPFGVVQLEIEKEKRAKARGKVKNTWHAMGKKMSPNKRRKQAALAHQRLEQEGEQTVCILDMDASTSQGMALKKVPVRKVLRELEMDGMVALYEKMIRTMAAKRQDPSGSIRKKAYNEKLEARKKEQGEFVQKKREELLEKEREYRAKIAKIVQEKSKIKGRAHVDLAQVDLTPKALERAGVEPEDLTPEALSKVKVTEKENAQVELTKEEKADVERRVEKARVDKVSSDRHAEIKEMSKEVERESKKDLSKGNIIEELTALLKGADKSNPKTIEALNQKIIEACGVDPKIQQTFLHNNIQVFMQKQIPPKNCP